MNCACMKVRTRMRYMHESREIKSLSRIDLSRCKHSPLVSPFVKLAVITYYPTFGAQVNEKVVRPPDFPK